MLNLGKTKKIVLRKISDMFMDKEIKASGDQELISEMSALGSFLVAAIHKMGGGSIEISYSELEASESKTMEMYETDTGFILRIWDASVSKVVN